MFEVEVIDTPSLGDRSYLVHDGAVAFVVDPQRDIDRVVAAAGGLGVRIVDVFETHIHNDYVTGGYALARATGARYHVNAADPVGFTRQAISDGERVAVSPALTVRAVAAPGHTPTHLAYLLEHAGRVVAVFSGGSLLFSTTGRPDLLGPRHTQELVHAQWNTARRLGEAAPDEAGLYPTHGFGSFCSVGQAEVATSTIGAERAGNPVFRLAEASWVEEVLAGLDAWPAYYAHMAPANLAGPDAPDLDPPAPADAVELRRRLAAGEWLVDLRHRKAFCEGHVPGALSFPLDGSMATYLGWLLPWGTPVTLLGETSADVAAGQRELVRIGIDRPAAAATGHPEAWTGGAAPQVIRRASFADLAAERARRPVEILDVRMRLEWEDAHLDGAAHIPLHVLPGRLTEVEPGEVWVHCQTGYRAAVAASLLARARWQPVVVDDDFSVVPATGLPLVGRAC